MWQSLADYAEGLTLSQGGYTFHLTHRCQIPKAGDILFTTEAPLGNVALFPSDGKIALGQRIIKLQCKAKKCVPEFLFQSLLGPQMQETIDFHSTGSTATGGIALQILCGMGKSLKGCVD